MNALTRVQRPMRLVSWLVKSVIPQGYIGTYALHTDRSIVYVGRSDDLRRRLIEHADCRRAGFFTYDVHRTPLHAYEVESAMFHSLGDTLTNQIHPAAPPHSGAICPFCRTSVTASLNERIDIRTGLSNPPRIEPLSNDERHHNV